MQLTHRFPTWLLWLLIGIACLAFVHGVSSVLLPFVAGAFTAYFLDPVADRLERIGWSRGGATALITIVFFMLVIAVLVLIVPVAVEQSSNLITALPDYALSLQARYQEHIARWTALVQLPTGSDSISNLAQGATTLVANVAKEVFASSMALFQLLSLLLITPLVSFYLLRDWDALTARLDQLLPVQHAPTIREQLRQIDFTLAAFVRGQVNVCLAMAAYYALGLSLAGLPFGFVIGVVAGLLVILPYVGFAFSVTVAMAVAFTHMESWWLPGITAAVFAGGQLLESYWLTPKLVGNRVGLHPLWIIFGMLAGATLMGLTGVMLAVPITAVLGVLVRFAVARYERSSLYLGT